MNYYPHHIGDYLRDTAHLTALEDGIYRRMLDVYYASEKPLPLDRDWLRRLLRATDEPSGLAVDVLLKEFFEQKEDGWHNKRADDEIRKARRRIKAAKTNGKRGGRKKTQQEPSGFPVGSQNQALQKPKAKVIKEADPPPNGGPLWNESLSILTEQGLSEKSARAFLGMLCRDWEEEHIVDAVRASVGKADAIAYIRGVLRSLPKKGSQAALKVAMP